MLKKAVLIVVSTMLILFGASLSFANQIGGMVSGVTNGVLAAPTLPAGIQASINPGGIGDALLYSYYNVRGNVNLFNIVNTDAVDGEKVRVIFRSAKTSKECLDFSVCLSRGDVWTGFLLDNGTTASVFGFDSDTITAPTIPSGGQPFKFGTYGPITVTADDCREGYFEVVGMSKIYGYDKNSANTAGCAVGTTSNCIRSEAACIAWAPIADGAVADAQDSLMGNNTIVDLANLATYSLNATAVADAALLPFDVPGGSEVSIPFAMSVGRTAAQGCDEADYIFMKSEVISPYDLIGALGGETEMVLTFPTRLICHSDSVLQTNMFNGSSADPTTNVWTKYCTTIIPNAWDDKEHLLTITDFSPSVGTCLPWEVNVIRVGGSNIWDSTVASIAPVGSFDLGWLDIDLVAGDALHTITYGGVTQNGLPAVGQTSQSFISGAATYMLPAATKTAFPLP